MIAEDPLALSYLLPGDVYILAGEKAAFALTEEEAVTEAAPEVKAAEPVVAYTRPEVSEPVAEVKKVTVTVSITPPPLEKIVAAEVSVAPVSPPTPVTVEAPAINYIGGYQKKFLVVVDYPGNEVMEAAHLAALEATLKRRDLVMDDVAVFNLAKHPDVDLKGIGRFFKPQKMLMLGALPTGLDAPPLNLLTKLGKCDILYSFSFGEMMGNKDNTRAFWEQVKLL